MVRVTPMQVDLDLTERTEIVKRAWTLRHEIALAQRHARAARLAASQTESKQARDTMLAASEDLQRDELAKTRYLDAFTHWHERRHT